MSDADGVPAPEPPVLPPTALCGDPGDQRVYLAWNPQYEFPEVVGWQVRQTAPEADLLTDGTLTEPAFVVEGLENGTPHEFVVVGVLEDGSTTGASNAVEVTPRETGEATVENVADRTREVGGRTVELSEDAHRIRFPDGQELVYDGFRPVDWQTRDGEHLLYPEHFGNGLDVGRLDEDGLGTVIPPGGLDGDEDAQHDVSHPYVTDPLTQPARQPRHDSGTYWQGAEVDGDRVTVHYWLPLDVMGYDAWTYVLVWETWWPLERDRGEATYHGLAREVEVEVPSFVDDGYQVMLNDGFGPEGGSRDGVTSYSAGFRNPAHEVVDFSPAENRTVVFQTPTTPRQGNGYHPNHDSLQASPLVFYDWGDGAMTVTGRHLYYHAYNNSSSYPEQGVDGVWPNLAWDLAVSGRRERVDTLEYLYTPDAGEVPLPQRYLDAKIGTYDAVSERMGVQDELTGVLNVESLGEVRGAGGPRALAEQYAEEFAGTAMDTMRITYDFWHASPETVPERYRVDPEYDCNVDIAACADILAEAGIAPGFWFRPELVKTSLATALSDRIPAQEPFYKNPAGDSKYPDPEPKLAERGLPEIREHRDRIRLERDGSYPTDTPYDWVPMSLATEWWDEVMWPTLWTSAEMGFEFVLQDGSFGGLEGVDYAPRLRGDRDRPVAAQPYWWKMFRSMSAVGLDLVGECTAGWTGGDVKVLGDGDQYYPWLMTGSLLRMDQNAHDELADPETLHRLFQLYNTVEVNRIEHDQVQERPVARFAKELYDDHGAPDRIELCGLEPRTEVEATVEIAESPVAGASTRVSEDDTVTFDVEPWEWTSVVWHFEDGSTVVYPAYDDVDWSQY